MKAPLYSVSVGELGINPAELEEKLREILDIASTWGAQILIDEADIFLERRNENDITRNAMVGVFLRLLEYHQGVLFLTTNRVKNIDEAFYSRISVALHYQSLSVVDRKKIWINLLKCAKVEGLDVDKLAAHNVNGRQIKTTIRLAQALAKEKNEKVSMKHILATISIQEQFVNQLVDMNNTPKKLEQLNG
jgi:SpoVK/Ycf46/Vps4 family AAA+-type ATPase